MADNIIDKEKFENTNTFYVNPEGYNEVEGEVDSMGVSFPESEYKEGIEVPDKFVTANGDIHYHLLDAVNVSWDNVKIPWAKRITKWGGAGYQTDEFGEYVIDDTGNYVLNSNSDMYNPTYKYNKPAEGSWADGTLKESEEVADILNYLIYRVISLDYFMDNFDERDLKSVVLRLVSHSNKWAYALGREPDVVDGENTDVTIADNKITVSTSTNLVAVLYPYLFSNRWEQKDTEHDDVYEEYEFNNNNGVLVSDLGQTGTTGIIYNIVSGKYFPKQDSSLHNYDIYDVTLRNRDGDINVNYDDAYQGLIHTILVQEMRETTTLDNTERLYSNKLAVIACKCAKSYQYSSDELFNTIVTSNTNYDAYNTKETIESGDAVNIEGLDPDAVTVEFNVSVPKANGYTSAYNTYKVDIYKGENSISMFYLVNPDTNVSKVTTTLKNQAQYYTSSGIANTLREYVNFVTIPNSSEEYEEDSPNRNLFRSKIMLDMEFGKDDNIMPYFFIRPQSATDQELQMIYSSCVNLAAIEDLHTCSIEELCRINDYLDNNGNIYMTLFDNASYNNNGNLVPLCYGKITYEYDVDSETGDFYYYPPTRDILGTVNGDIDIEMSVFMYYPYGDKETDRILKPVIAKLPISLKPIYKNEIVFFDSKESTPVYTTTMSNMHNYSGTFNDDYIDNDGNGKGKTFYKNDTLTIGEDIYNYTYNYAICTKEYDHLNPISFDMSDGRNNVSRSIYSKDINIELAGIVLPEFADRTLTKASITSEERYESSELGRTVRSGISGSDDNLQMEMEYYDTEFEYINMPEYFSENENHEIIYTYGGISYSTHRYLDENSNAYYVPYKTTIFPKIRTVLQSATNLYDSISLYEYLQCNDIYSVADIMKHTENDVTDLTGVSPITVNDMAKSEHISLNRTSVSIPNSTAMFPFENGMLATEDYSHIFDADNDYYWIAIRITCDRNYTSTTGVMYDECEGYYFIKVKRENRTISLTRDDTKDYRVRRDIYLDTIFNNETMELLRNFEGKRRWKIDYVIENGEKYVIMDNIHRLPIEDHINLYNVNDTWKVRDFVRAYRSDIPASPVLVDPENPIGVMTYFADQYFKTEPTTYDVIVTEKGKPLGGGTFNGTSQGAVLAINKFEKTSDGNLSPVEAASVTIPLEYHIGNDMKYKRQVCGINVSVNKREYDITIYGAHIVNGVQRWMYFSNQTLEITGTYTDNYVIFYFFSNELGDQDLVIDYTSSIERSDDIVADITNLNGETGMLTLSNASFKGDAAVQPAAGSLGSNPIYIYHSDAAKQEFRCVANDNVFGEGNTNVVTINVTINKDAVYQSKTIPIKFKRQ